MVSTATLEPGTQFYCQSVGACAHTVATQEREVTWKHITELSNTSAQTNECDLGSQADNGTRVLVCHDTEVVSRPLAQVIQQLLN